MGEYVIQPGDTLSKIAKMTGTSVEQLQKLNGIKNANLIFAGKTIQIPDIESDQAFKLKGLSVERKIPKAEWRTVYAYIPPEKDTPADNKKDGKLELPKGDIRTLYAYIPPEDEGGIRYEPVYAYKPPKEDEGEDDGEIRYEPVYAYKPPVEDVEEPKIRATAKDNELLESRGASKTANNPNGRAQFVVGDETGEVSVTGQKERPDSITIKDDTNGHTNTYTYRLITDKEIADGKTYDGIPLSKNQFEGKGPFYVLIKAENESGENLKGSHTEVYRLDYSETDDGSRSYDLVQDEGMDGSGRSSMDYRRR